MADASVPELSEESIKTLRDAGLTPDDLYRDSKELLESVKKIQGITEGMTKENAVSSFETYFDMVSRMQPLIQKYQGDPTLERMLDNVVGDGFSDGLLVAIAEFEEKNPGVIDETLKTLQAKGLDLEKFDRGEQYSEKLRESGMSVYQTVRTGKTIGQMNCTLGNCGPEAAAIQQNIQRLSKLYNELDDMILHGALGVTNKKITEKYEAFLEGYEKFLEPYKRNNKIETPYIYERVKTELDQKIGIPQEIFRDKGAHYVGVIAERIKECVNLAKVQKPPSYAGDPEKYETQYGAYLGTQRELYDRAADIMRSSSSDNSNRNEKEKLPFVIDRTELERRAGVTLAYLDQQERIISETEDCCIPSRPDQTVRPLADSAKKSADTPPFSPPALGESNVTLPKPR